MNKPTRGILRRAGLAALSLAAGIAFAAEAPYWPDLQAVQNVLQTAVRNPQQQGKPDSSDDTINAKIYLHREQVFVFASVVNSIGDKHLKMDKESFKILEDGVPQTITSFSNAQQPVTLGLVVDNSGSLRDHYDQVTDVLNYWVEPKNRMPKDEIFPVSFSARITMDAVAAGATFVTTKAELQRFMHQYRVRGESALFDAVYVSAQIAAEEGSKTVLKKALLVLSDGENSASKKTLQQAIRQAQKARVSVYAIALPDPFKYGDRNKGLNNLEQLTKQTGGIKIQVESFDTDKIGEACRLINEAIHNQYLLGYTSTNSDRNKCSERDEEHGCFRKIEVQAWNSHKVRLPVFAQPGYYVSTKTRKESENKGDSNE